MREIGILLQPFPKVILARELSYKTGRGVSSTDHRGDNGKSMIVKQREIHTDVLEKLASIMQ